MAKRVRNKANPGRVLAYEFTREVRQRDAFLRELIDARRQTSALSSEDFAFAQVLSFGVIMCSGTLDVAINRSLKNPRDIKPKVRDCLRISAYELLFLHKPDHVVVNEGVELVRHVAARASGLANAVLRKMALDAQAFPWGDADEDDGAFARELGVPTWLAVRLIGQYGRQSAQRMLSACLEAAPTYLRDNPFMQGERFASDLSAQFVASLVPLDEPMLEIGAGRGTKTMLMESRALEELEHSVAIHALDLHEYRAQLLEERMRANGVGGVTAHCGDARKLDEVEGLPTQFESVFVDAPCSGTGTLRRHPEIRWRLSPEDVDELAQLQLAMLKQAAGRVASGGTLVYATCSVFEQENQGVIEAFLASDEGEAFHVCALDGLHVPAGAVLSDGSAVDVVPANWRVDELGCFTSVPASNAPDGHFACVLMRE